MTPQSRYESLLLQQKSITNDGTIASVVSAAASRAAMRGTLECHGGVVVTGGDDNGSSSNNDTETIAACAAVVNNLRRHVEKVSLGDWNNKDVDWEEEEDCGGEWEVDIDGFFEEFPECRRDGRKNGDEDDDDDDWSDEENDIGGSNGISNKTHDRMERNDGGFSAQGVAQLPSATRSISQYGQGQTTEYPPRAQDMSLRNMRGEMNLPPNNQLLQRNRNFSRTAQAQYSSNPYQQRRQYNNEQQQQQQYPPAGNVNANASSWEEHNQKVNPFQTAREFAALNEDDNGPEQQASHDQRRSHQQTTTNTTAPSPSRRPNLSAGLKRKFQPPKKVAKSQKPSHSTSGAGANGGSKSRSSCSNHNPNNDDNDDDELPEELKGLDKELIEKIENEILDDAAPITFDDIAGLNDAKQTVQELVVWPMKRPDLFTGLRRGPNGLLLFGPPGTGKTLIGKAISHECNATFFSISSSSLTSKWIGEGEKLVRTLFAVASYREPSVVFIDEIDSLLTQRKADENEASRRIKTEFLVQIDGTSSGGKDGRRLLVIGATNRPEELDDAARRRFVKRLYVPLPTCKDREVLMRTLLRTNRHSLTGADLEVLARDTEGFSGADLKALCTDAALGPIRGLGRRALDIAVGDVPPIGYKHFKKSLRGMNPSVAQSDLDGYLKFNELYGSKNASQEGSDDSDDE